MLLLLSKSYNKNKKWILLTYLLNDVMTRAFEIKRFNYMVYALSYREELKDVHVF